MTTLHFERMDSPIGTLVLAADAAGLRHIEFPTNRHPVDRAGWVPGARGAVAETLAETRAQLDAYFAGTRRAFDLPLAPAGTPFQRTVWAMLAEIPWGATWSYGQLAKAIGQPAAVRAVGAANGRNPLPIVLPCHRVIGSDGQLTGFGGGLPTKAALLRLEGALPVPAAAATGDLFG
ncbi:MAG: methylated-DNA--[protein]-cysteine S-methyltransferase [Lysobacteraceae bacterium]